MAIDVPPQPALWLPPKPAIITRASAEDLALIRSARREHRRASFPFPVFMPGSKVPVTGGYRNYYTDLTSGSSSYSFSSIDTGTAAANRYIVLGIIRNVTSAGAMPTAVNLNGTAVFSQVAIDSGSSKACSIWRSNDPFTSGGTATANVTLGGISGFLRIYVWAIYGVNPTPYATGAAASASSSAVSLNTNTIKDGVSLGIVHIGCPGSPSADATWTGLTKNQGGIISSSNGAGGSAATLLTTSTETPRTISASLTAEYGLDEPTCRACAVSFGPA